MLPLSPAFAFSEGRGKHRAQDAEGSAPKPEPLKREEKGRRELGDPPGGRATKKTGLERGAASAAGHMICINMTPDAGVTATEPPQHRSNVTRLDVPWQVTGRLLKTR